MLDLIIISRDYLPLVDNKYDSFVTRVYSAYNKIQNAII